MACAHIRATSPAHPLLRAACGLLGVPRSPQTLAAPMFERPDPASAPRIWDVGALCRAVADALEARFNPVAVRGEITGFSRASSGHCYFSIKDGQGQIRCAMFRRAAMLLDGTPRDGEMVELRGRLAVYEARGDLQLIVESLQRAGQGALFEQFLRLKARLESEGLFDSARKRGLPVMPRSIGLVTSPGAAALHDVVTALRRRVPHLPVVLAPALVQGAAAPASICAALRALYRMAEPSGDGAGHPPVEVILLVRGGGSIEDLWAFNDEPVARTLVQSPVPVVSGVGHETDFTIADFCADLRAPTPTAAAELVAQPQATWLAGMDALAGRLSDSLQRQIDGRHQRLDMAAQRLGRPSGLVARQELRLARLAQQLRHGAAWMAQRCAQRQDGLADRLPRAVAQGVARQAQRLDHAALRLELLDPRLVLQRGYALLTDSDGLPVTRTAQVRTGDTVRAAVSDGEIDLTVSAPRLL